MKHLLISLFIGFAVLNIQAQQVAENNINGFEIKVNYKSAKHTLDGPIEVGEFSINKNAKLGLNGENTIEAGTYQLSLVKKEGGYFYGLKHGQSAKKVEMLVPADNPTTVPEQGDLLVNIHEPTPENGMGILQISWSTQSVQLYLNPIAE